LLTIRGKIEVFSAADVASCKIGKFHKVYQIGAGLPNPISVGIIHRVSSF